MSMDSIKKLMRIFSHLLVLFVFGSSAILSLLYSITIMWNIGYAEQYVDSVIIVVSATIGTLIFCAGSLTIWNKLRSIW